MDDDHSYDDGGFEGPRDPFYDAMTQQALDQIRILREAGLEQTYRDALHHDSSPEAEAAFWRAHGLPMHLLRLPDLVTSDPAARAADRVQNRGYRRLSKEAWEAAGTAYLAGSTAEEVSAVYGMAVSTFRARAKDEGWRREDQPDPLREPIDLEAETADGLPDYYRQNFHFQSDGWLSDHSAALYDTQVEVLFTGAADAMRRRALAPIARWLQGRNQREVRGLDVGCGTGVLAEEDVGDGAQRRALQPTGRGQGLAPVIAIEAILNAKGDSLRRRWEGNFAGASAPLVLNVLLDHLQRCSAARARKVRA